MYLRFTHVIGYRRLTQLFLHLYGLQISEGALDAMLQRAKPCFDNEVAAILSRLRRSRIVGCDETSVRIDGRTHWNWVFQNDQVVIHVVRNSRAASVVTETMAGHRPSIWVSDLYGAQQGHADLWQVCLAHQLRDCKFAIAAGDTIFAPRMKALLLRAVVQARRRKHLAESTRRSYQRRLDRDLNTIMVLAPTNPDGTRLRRRYGKLRSHLFTFLEHPEAPPDNNASERDLRPTATYRKVTGGFRSQWGADLFAGVRSVVGTAARQGKDAYHAILVVLDGGSVPQAGRADTMFSVWILDYIFALGFGIVFQYFTIAPMRGLSLKDGLVAAIKADTLSLTAWQVGMHGFMALAYFGIFGAGLGIKLETNTVEFWFMMQIAMMCGLATSYPVNWWLIIAGVKERM